MAVDASEVVLHQAEVDIGWTKPMGKEEDCKRELYRSVAGTELAVEALELLLRT